MVQLHSEDFGKPISLNSAPGEKYQQMGAHGMISQFLNLKNSYRAYLDELTKGDAHATRYYCSNDCAYIFNIEILRALVRAVDEHPTADKSKERAAKGCVVLFQGVRRSFDPQNPDPGCPFGRPTLIATAYVQEGEELKYIPIPGEFYPYKKLDGDIDAFEHPGDGNDDGTTTLKDYQGSVVRKIVDDEMADTEYIIRDTLTDDNLKGWISRKKDSK